MKSTFGGSTQEAGWHKKPATLHPPDLDASAPALPPASNDAIPPCPECGSLDYDVDGVDGMVTCYPYGHIIRPARSADPVPPPDPDDSAPARPAVDHGPLSPSGRVSKRTREAALERTRRELFGDGLAYPSIAQPTEAESLRQHAARLRDLAERGMKPRAYRKQAERLEAEAERLAAGRPAQTTTGGTDDGQSQDQEGAKVEQAQGLERPQEVLSTGGQHDAR